MSAQLKLTDEVADVIVAALKKGASQAVAASLAGISKRSLERWLQVGRAYQHALEAGEPVEERHEPMFRLLRRVKNQEAQFLLTALDCIELAASQPQTWQAAAWLLERKAHDDFGRHAPKQAETSEESRTIVIKHEIPGFEDE